MVTKLVPSETAHFWLAKSHAFCAYLSHEAPVVIIVVAVKHLSELLFSLQLNQTASIGLLGKPHLLPNGSLEN